MTVIDGREPHDGDDYHVLHDATSGHDDRYDHEDEREFDLSDEDESLPWLDSDYDDEDDDGVDGLRIVGFVLLGLLALGILLGLIYWLSNRNSDQELVADGSTIPAPEGPIKEKPEDAGGREFEGTGNVAPKVGEGESSEGRLADSDDSPRPSIDAAGSRNSNGSGSNTGSGTDGDANDSPSGGAGAASAGGGVGVQVGAFSNRNRAEAAWRTLNSQSTALNGFKYRVVEGQVDGSTVFRLQAVAADADSARKLCNALKADGLACQVK